ncbi:phosphatidylinositol 3 and 4-kinase-like protein [Phytophthora sojae]|uniref:Phosphatidylinositol 3 and 4-kinase-like protein n=1 Tax=Phytophthora sojae (strain P6497) TaxID=1094619 RepID=G4ZMR0_PHYSP|nr:phosphatidylinositol 3 and 4-kinase-like protein [Phytophthora sojae]EGZ16030.1 phosphatidylinositol 3 and 4-kinase-like protein [Phytophthora sojae]|eukprot:XP_009529779.1 phosphatidylinositol 3 and 4-kinase-like protein [Phytophthora sojae]
MGAVEWFRGSSDRADDALAPEQDGRKRIKSRFSRLRLHGSAMLNAKGLLQQTVVTKLVQFRLAPLRCTSPFKRDSECPIILFGEKGECAEPETELPAGLDAKWLTTEAAERFAEQVKCMVADTGSSFQMTSEGCGGAYFLSVESMDNSSTKKMNPLGIFKPRDEEYMAPKNPRGYVKENAVVGVTEHPVNKGFRVGNGALRERAAYLLDNAYGSFSGVPVTNLMVLSVNGEEKEGSMQRFVASQCSAEDMGTLKFAIPEVHKIGILDVRLFNTDRHAGNILLSARPNDQTFGMTPIDHGFCLPSYKQLDGATFDWLQWPQAEFPFTCAELDHIASLDEARDAAVLRAVGIEEECVTTMRVCTAVLKRGAEAGFSLFEIGSLLQRDGDFTSPSQLELVVAKAAKVVEEDMNMSEEKDGVAFFDAIVAESARQAESMFEGQTKKKVRSISCFS